MKAGPIFPPPVASPEPPVALVPGRAAVPMWLVALTGLLTYWAVLYLDRNAGGFAALVFDRGDRAADVAARVPKPGAEGLVAHGERIYGVYCAVCHQADGRGRPGQFPPLVGSDWLNAPGARRPIRIVLDGVAGPLTVNGQGFNNAMLPWRGHLSDADIAAVLTFVGTHPGFQNHGVAVTPAHVKAIRDATQERRANWTEAELLAVPTGD